MIRLASFIILSSSLAPHGCRGEIPDLLASTAPSRRRSPLTMAMLAWGA